MLDQLLAEFQRPMSLPLPVVTLRLVMALLLGGVIGWEREAKHRQAGLRTHMLISLAAACFTLVAMELAEAFRTHPGEQRTDPFRLIEAVTAGVAFLAAGSIITRGGDVRGVTTGASMWLCGAIGLCCGTGDLWLAIMVTLLAIAVLFVVRQLISPVLRDED
ncbi:MgtC/SapB family protein [Paracoccus laeviglucosivorans]|uniref:Protein MgtC n=1 Tax=Paracoccus laeviglucosivorans TaxID=1197861 RepID=A0A521CT06_9RHOB|nr:MgtC/SapB family protein [Paracoccus laeviglucosivorans]SMO62518.1 putative Mg2+ transporter-C (MgtC) family protein [Paracoccus laeviglucosivorans]